MILLIISLCLNAALLVSAAFLFYLLKMTSKVIRHQSANVIRESPVVVQSAIAISDDLTGVSKIDEKEIEEQERQRQREIEIALREDFNIDIEYLNRITSL